MRHTITPATLALLLLAGCGGDAGNGTDANTTAATGETRLPPTRRQAGSWSQQVQVVRLEDPKSPPEAKAQLQGMFDMMKGMTVCMTPDAVAKEDIGKNLEKTASKGEDCVFDKKDFNGDALSFSGVCKSAKGERIRISGKGTSGATAQDITLTVENLGLGDTPVGVMEMRMTAKREGACKPTDITPPVEGTKQ